MRGGEAARDRDDTPEDPTPREAPGTSVLRDAGMLALIDGPFTETKEFVAG